MEKDTVVTLDDNSEYILLEKLELDKEEYFLGVKLEKNTGEPTKEYEVFKSEKDGEDYYLTDIEDDDLKIKLIEFFAKKFEKEFKKDE